MHHPPSPLPIFALAHTNSDRVGAVLRAMDDETQIQIARMSYDERAELLLNVQSWCARFRAYHSQGREKASGASST